MLDVKLQLQKFIKRIEKVVDKDISSAPILRKLGEEVANRVRLRTRLGYGVTENGQPRQSLKSMRQHSVAYRLFRQQTILSGMTSPAKHNLTLTGAMLENLGLKKVDAALKKVEIGFSDSFSQLKADVNSKRGWRFLHLSDTEIKSVNNFYKREVAALVKQAKLD
jgi:hypothetical protein